MSISASIRAAGRNHPLLRRVGRKRLIRTAAMRRRDALILRVLAHHTGRRFEDIRTQIEWGPIFSRDPGALLPGAGVAPAGVAG